jgi:hypothetical protein
MGRGVVFECHITVSAGVRHKLLKKHRIEVWEIEEVVYEDSDAFSLTCRDCHFIYGQTFAGRYLIVLVRVLSPQEVSRLGFASGTNVLKIIAARDMNPHQRRTYIKRRS